MLEADKKNAIIKTILRSKSEDNNIVILSDKAKEIIAQPVEKNYSSAIIVGLVQFFEALFLGIIGLLIFYFYVVDSSFGFYLAVIIIASLFANILFNISLTHSIGAYRNFLRQIGRVLACWAFVIVSILIVAFLLKITDDVSRVWLVSWFVLGSIFLIFYRFAIKTLVQKWTKAGKLKRRTVIVGGGKDAEFLVNAINKGANNDIELLGLFDERDDKRSPKEVAGCPKLGNINGLIEFARQTKIDLIIVSLPLSAENRVLYMLTKLWVLPVDIRLSAHMSKIRFEPKTYSFVGDVAVFDMANKPISDWNMVFKWIFDKIVAILAIIILSPIMIITAIAIKLESRGPILFKQKRHGFNNEVFTIYKFRSMYVDQLDEKAEKQVDRNDKRVTRVGKFIRKTSIDELPQLFNVLKNDLSIVGPRPHVLEGKAENKLYSEIIDGYFARHKVKPGITGWAQINGWRGGTDTADKILRRVEHDLYYIENWSLLFDLKILLLTPISLISKSENAY